MYEQVIPFVERFLSPLLFGFRNGYNTQHALLEFSETCTAAIDSGGFAGAPLMDLSKAFDCLNHEQLLAKMHVYGFSRSALTLIHSGLSNRKQMVKMNGSSEESGVSHDRYLQNKKKSKFQLCEVDF